MRTRAKRSLAARVDTHLSEPDLTPIHKRVIERALRWAWNEVRSRWPTDVASAAEEVITAHIEWVLSEFEPNCARLRAPGLSMFNLARGAKVRAADGRIEKAPDLTFRPPSYAGIRNRTDWGWFVECKIIAGNVWVAKYMRQGVERFASAEYACRMPSAAMIAYVRDGSVPQVVLPPYLSSALQMGPVADVVFSQHDRAALTPPCTKITITHLWFHV